MLINFTKNCENKTFQFAKLWQTSAYFLYRINLWFPFKSKIKWTTLPSIWKKVQWKMIILCDCYLSIVYCKISLLKYGESIPPYLFSIISIGMYEAELLTIFFHSHNITPHIKIHKQHRIPIALKRIVEFYIQYSHEMSVNCNNKMSSVAGAAVEKEAVVRQ